VFFTVLAPTQPPRSAPTSDQVRSYALHLYWDVAWYGLLAGSSLAFVTVYLTRLGATPWQIGLMNAGPALIGLIFTLPIGRWLYGRPIGKAVFGAAIFHRAAFLLWAVFPLIFTPILQIWSYIAITLVMTIFGTVVAIGFNALYAAAVPVEQRGRVAGVRNAVLSLTYVLTSLGCGYLLDALPMEIGYPVVFFIGFIGGVGSLFHLWFLRGLKGDEGIEPSQVRSPIGDFARPGSMRFLGISLRSSVALRAFARGTRSLQLRVMRTRYGVMVGALFFFHFAQYLPIALFPIYWVDVLGFSDQQISLGTALFHTAVLLGSLQLAKLTRRMGNLWLIVMGVVGLSLYPLVNAYANGLGLYLVASLIGGAAWALLGGALGNYLLDIAPANDRPAHLAWYNIALNAGILLGSLCGPMVAGWIGLRPALLSGFVLRLASAGLIWLAGVYVARALPRPRSS
jgi:predicted MFS family arabinose efflux permease